MKNIVNGSVTVGNKRYAYTLKVGKKTTFVRCDVGKIAQSFLNEDIPALIVDLPYLIEAEKEYQKKQDNVIRFRVTQEDKKAIEKKAVKNGFSSVSGYLRSLALRGL